MKNLLKWETWDHPLVHLALLTPGVIAFIVLYYWIADRVGLPLPPLGQPTRDGSNS